MRVLSIPLATALLLAGCHSTATSPAATGEGWGNAAPATAAATDEERVARWEREWEEAKRKVAMARADAAAAGEPVAPEVDRQVMDLLNRRIDDAQGTEARIEDLQDAVSDALRLAELVSIG